MPGNYVHGQAQFARKRHCTCQPCVTALLRYAARKDGIVDDIAVERLISGDLDVWTTQAEKVEAVARLSRAGLSASEIGGRMGQTKRNVERLLADNQLVSP